jgi:hypothetical protein
MYRALCTDLQILVHVVRIPDVSLAVYPRLNRWGRLELNATLILIRLWERVGENHSDGNGARCRLGVLGTVGTVTGITRDE